MLWVEHHGDTIMRSQRRHHRILSRFGRGHIVWMLGVGAALSLGLASCSSSPDQPTLSDTQQTSGPLTYYKDIQPIYRNYCVPCHAGCTPDVCPGDSCFVTDYDALLLEVEEGMTFAEFGLFRIEATKSGVDPENALVGTDNGPIIVPDEDVDKIKQWLQEGMLQGTPPAPSSTECIPDCTNKECGCDGCGGLCEGTCPKGLLCANELGTCSVVAREFDPNCVPQCYEGMQCGHDGCGGECPNLCGDLECNKDTCQCINPTD